MGQPIRGMTRPLPVKASIIPAVIPPEVVTLDANFNASIHNRFDVEVIDAQTGKIKQRAQAENVICSQLWTRLFAPDTYFNYIHYGTGSGTPASTDTSLFTFLGCDTPLASNDVYSVSRENCVYSFRRKIQLSETTAVGSTLTEVGIGYSASSSSLCTHAMLKDANGNQISIAKTGTDIINVYATIYIHWPNSLNTGDIMFSSAIYFGKYLAGMYSSFFSPPTRAQIGPNRNTRYDSAGTTYTNLSWALSATTKKLTLTCNRFSASSGNIGGGIWYVNLFGAVSSGYCLYPCFALKAGGDWYTGTDIVGEAIGTGDGTATDFATSFDCPSNTTIYIDGVTSAATVDNVPLAYNDMGRYFETIDVENGTAYPSAYGNEGISAAYSLYGAQYNSLSHGGQKYSVFYNPFYVHGIKQYYASSAPIVEVSNDLAAWTVLSTTSGTRTVPTDYVNYKYWRITSYSGDNNVSAMISNALTGKNIHFTSAPANGAVITADYHTPTIAKDTNHVFDLTVTIQLGEYTS